MATAAPPGGRRPRRLALCVDVWASDATLVTWSFARRLFLRVRGVGGGGACGWRRRNWARRASSGRRPTPTPQKRRGPDGADGLDPRDRLFIVHVAPHTRKPTRAAAGWYRGGPLVPPLTAALAAYPFTLVALEAASPAAAIVEFAAASAVDVLILGGRDGGRSAASGAGTADAVRRHAPCAVLCVRPTASRHGLRIRSEADLGALLAPPARAGGGGPAAGGGAARAARPRPARRIMLAFDGAPAAARVAARAAAGVLFPDDDVVLAALRRAKDKDKEKEKEGDGDGAHAPDADAAAAAALDAARSSLTAYATTAVVVPAGADAKSALIDAATAAGVDLLILEGAAPPKRLRSGLGGASLAGHATRRGPCPVLVLPPPPPPPAPPSRRSRRRGDRAGALSPGGDSPRSPAAGGGTDDDERRPGGGGASSDGGAPARPVSRTSSLAAAVLSGLRLGSRDRDRAGGSPPGTPDSRVGPAPPQWPCSPPSPSAPPPPPPPRPDPDAAELAVVRWRLSERDAEVAALRARVAALEAALSERGGGGAHDTDEESDGGGGGGVAEED